jgi:hypothetical protein
MSRTVLLTTLVCLALAGCNGPKGSPEGSVKSFFSAAEDQDWGTMVEIIEPDSIKKVGAQRVQSFYADMFKDVRSVDVSIQEVRIVHPDQEAVVSFQCTATFRALGQMAYDRGCADIYTLKYRDGSWYIVLPATQQLRPAL